MTLARLAPAFLRRRVIRVVVGVVATPSLFHAAQVGAQHAAQRDSQPPVSAIRAARAASNEAIAAHDAARVTSFMDAAYVGISSRNSRSVGRESATAEYTQIFATRPGVVFVRTPVAITVNEKWGQAGERGQWTGRWSGADGPVRVGGDYFAKWRRSGGRWKLFAETFVQTRCTGGVYCTAPPPIAAPDPNPSFGLSHVYVAVDSATYADIAASAFLRNEMGAFETRTTRRLSGATYSGTYLYGRQTYVELQHPDSTRASDLGQLYLGTDRRGDIHRAAERLVQHGVPTSLEMNTRGRGAENVPWSYAINVQPDADELSMPLNKVRFMMFVIEWHADFLRRWFPDIPAERAGMSRAEYLAPLWKPDRYLRDVVGVTFALDSAETETFATRIAALGYAVRRARGDVQASGPNVTINVVPASRTRHGTLALRFSLNRPKRGDTTYTIGTSTLAVSGDTAVWTFR